MQLDYNSRGELSRVFHSLSYATGFMAGIAVNMFQAAAGKENFLDNTRHETNRDLWTNTALGSITGWVQIAGLTSFSNPMCTIGLIGLISDACGYATGESFGAMKEGYRRERAYNTPKLAI